MNMKKGILAALMLLAAATGAAQTLDDIYDAFRDKPGVEIMELSSKQLLEQVKAQVRAQVQAQLADSTSLDSAQKEALRKAMEADIEQQMEKAGGKQLQALKRMESLTILSLKGEEAAALMPEFKERTAHLTDLGYETLVKKTTSDGRMHVLTRTTEDAMIELLVCSIENGEAGLVRIKGHIQPEEWKKMVGDWADED